MGNVADIVFRGRDAFLNVLGLNYTGDRPADFEKAIVATGFGKFHFCLLTITGLIYANSAIGVTVLSFVLPAATCDYELTPKDKGYLTAAPMLGMVVGSYFWGCLADTKGRKFVLIWTLLLDGFIGILSSLVQCFVVFVALRCVNGFAIAGFMGIVFPYLGEFQPTKYREKILCWMEMFWTLGVIVLPLIAWAIIPWKNHRISKNGFIFDSWNWFVAICSIPSVLLGFWMLSFPESPKFMMECGDYDDAMEVFRFMYKRNTGDDAENYPISSLQAKETHQHRANDHRSVRSLQLHKCSDLKRLCTEIWSQTKAICMPPYLRVTILTSIIQFGLTTSYFTLMVWFPELFHRYEVFAKEYPGTKASVCDLAGLDESKEPGTEDFTDCHIDANVFIHTLIVGLACIPTSLWLPLCVDRLGAKCILIFSLVVSGVSTLSLFLVRNATENLILSCIFEAFASLATSLILCILVDLYPTSLRVMAAAFSCTIGRLGGLVGNIILGVLLEIACAVPIVLFGVLLLLSAALSFLIPKTGHETLD